MNLFEEAVIYSTIMHTGMRRKGSQSPYILHPLEVSQIISTITDDIEVITAGVLHDVVEETDGTIDEIRKRFGDRVADIVLSETEKKYNDIPKSESWIKRKEESLLVLKNSTDIGVKILWLADKLSNIRSIAQKYAECGEETWQLFHQKDPKMHKWYYSSVAEILEIDLNRTGAFKEYISRINFIWPNTFHRDKAYYKKYREVSIEGLEQIGQGYKSKVYRYDDELILKVYNEKNIFKDIERENALARKAFIAGIPTAISFGIVSIGDKYGSLFELVQSNTVSNLIAKDPAEVEKYAVIMAELARQIHSTDATDMDIPDFIPEVYKWITQGIAHADKKTAELLIDMLDRLPKVSTMIHGDFHTGNVMQQGNDFLLIDMDRLSTCHPIVELSGVYMFYVGFGELDPSVTEKFMGFSYETAGKYFDYFMRHYFEAYDDTQLELIKKKCALLCYARLVIRVYKKGLALSKKDQDACDYYMGKIYSLLDEVSDLDINL